MAFTVSLTPPSPRCTVALPATTLHTCACFPFTQSVRFRGLYWYRYGPAPTTWPCHQHLLLGVGLGGCAGRGADSTSGHSACPRCSPALALFTEVAFLSVWKVQDQNEWQRSKGLGKHSQSVAILIQTVLCLLVNLLIFLTAMLQKERTKILPGDSKRTQGSKVPRSFKSVLRISYGGVIPTKPLAPTSSWLQDDCFCNALQSPCSSTAYGQLHSAEESTMRGKAGSSPPVCTGSIFTEWLLLVQDLCLTQLLHIPVLGIGLPSAKWTGQAEFNTNCRNASAEKHSAGCQDVKQAGETCRNPSSDSIYFYDGRPLLTVLS